MSATRKLKAPALGGIALALALAVFLVASLRSGVTPAPEQIAARRTAGARPVVSREGAPTSPSSPAAPALSGVVETAEGRPLAGARVTLARRHGVGASAAIAPGRTLLAVAVTGPDGAFTFADAPAGELTVLATARHFKPTSRSVTVSARLSPLELVLARGGVEVRGRVVDTGGGAIGAAEIVAVARDGDDAVWHALSDEQGEFRLALDAGAFSLAADAPGYARTRRELLLVADVADVILQLDAASAVSFTVVRSAREGGTPVAAADVSIRRAGDRGAPLELLRTDERGQASATLSDGRYVVDAHHAEASARIEVDVRLGLTNEFTLELSAGLRAEGRVGSAAGAAVPAARVELVDPGARHLVTLSDADGRFAFRGLLPGHYRLLATAHEHGSTSDGFDLSDDRDDLDLTFEDRDAKIVGRVLDEVGRPVSGATVRSLAIADASYARAGDSTTTGRDGSFELSVAPGVYGLEARRDAEVGRTDSFELASGQTKEIVVRIDTARFILGTVTWRDGAAVAGASVVASIEELHLGARAVSDGDGRYRVGPFPRGSRVLVLASAPDVPAGSGSLSGLKSRQITREDGSVTTRLQEVGSPNARMVTVGGADVSDVQLVLERANQRIQGRVVSKEGLPVEHAFIAAVSAAAAYELPDAHLGRSPRGVFSDGDGQFVLTEVERGTHAVVALHPDLGRSVLENVSAGASGVSIRFAPAARLKGEVVDADGDPVSAFSMTVRGSGPAREGTPVAHLDVASDDGVFDVRPCPAGEITLAVRDRSTGVVRRQSVSVRPGEVAQLTVRF